MAEMTRQEADASWAKYFHDKAKRLESENERLKSELALARGTAGSEKEVERYRTWIRSLLDNLRSAGTDAARGSDGWYLMMAISTLEKMLEARAALAETAEAGGVSQSSGGCS